MVDDFPTSEDDAAAPTRTTPVMGSVIVELQPDGTVVKSISLLDLLDPRRIGRSVFDKTGPLSSAYDTAGSQSADWDHANSVVYDPGSDSYYVSLRVQDAVVKVNRTSETLTWILGTSANWKAPWSDKLLTTDDVDFVWQYHQHAAKPLPDDRLILYDNGSYRAAAFETPRPEWSRAVIFQIHERDRRVTHEWSYGVPSGPDRFFSAYMGNANLLPATGNVLFVNATVKEGSTTYAQIIEVTSDGTRVFEMSLKGSSSGSVYIIYRAERIADIRR